MEFKPSENLINYIKQAEGFREKQYKDFTGKPTVGYGTSDGDIPKTMDKATAEATMRDRLSSGASNVAKMVKRQNLSQSQVDALIDFEYNLGAEKLQKSSLLQKINSGASDDEIAAEFLRYNKARNKDTGEMEVLPGLVERTTQRSSWWAGRPISPQMVNQENMPNLAAIANEVDEAKVNKLSDQVDSYLASEEESAREATPDVFIPEDNDLNFDQRLEKLSREVDQYESAGVFQGETVSDRVKFMHQARGIKNTDDIDRSTNVKALSKELGVEEQIIDADLQVYSPEQIRTKYAVPRIAKALPGLARWQKEPDNYVLAERTDNWTENVSYAAKGVQLVNQDSDYEKILKKRAYDYPIAILMNAVLSGAVSPEDAQVYLNDLEFRQNEIQLSSDAIQQMKNIEEARKMQLKPSAQKAVKGFWDGVEGALRNKGYDEVKEDLLEGFDGTGEYFDNLMTYLATMYENKKGAAVINLGSSVTSLPPAALVTIGAMTQFPFAKGALMTSGGGLAAMLASSQSFQEDLEPFRNKQTGQIDLVRAMQDPERVAKWRNGAAAYAGAMGAGEILYGKLAGKFFSKSVKKGAGKSVGRKAVAAGAAVAGEQAVGIGQEAATEFTARTAKNVAQDELTRENLAENVLEATDEGIFAGTQKGAMGAVAGSVRLVLPRARDGYFYVKDKLKRASKATDSLIAVQEAKSILSTRTESQTNKEQIKDLINKNLDPKEGAVEKQEVDMYDDSDPNEQQANREILEGQEQDVHIDSTDLIESLGDIETAAEFLNALPEDQRADALKSLELGETISMKMADYLLLDTTPNQIDEIIMVGDNDMNAKRANEEIDEVASNIRDYVKGDFVLFEEQDGDQAPPPLPEDIFPDIIGEPFNESEVIQPDEIVTDLRSPEEESAYKVVTGRILRASKKVKQISDGAAKAFAEIQFERVRTRAAVMNRPISEVARELEVDNRKSFGAAGTFNPVWHRIDLPQNDADVKTLVHEFGHSWLDEMSRDYTYLANIEFDKMTPAQQDYWHSMTIAADLLGMDNMGQLYSFQPGKTRKLHEAFAQTTERYFLEGYFGDAKTKTVMEKLRKYIAKFARQIAEYRARMLEKFGYETFEITPKVERMFEGIIGSEQAATQEAIRMFEPPMFDPKELGDTQFEYFSKAQEALLESIGEIASKIMKRSYYEREQLINQAFDLAFEAAEEKVLSRPEHVYALQMKDAFKQFKTNRDAGLDAQNPRISYDSMLELIGDEKELIQLRGRFPTFMLSGKKKGGVDVSYFMQALGLQNKADVIRTLFSINDVDQQIIKEANKIVEEKFPQFKTDEQIREETVATMGGLKRQKFLQLEMKILAQKYLPTLKNVAGTLIESPERKLNSEFTDNEARERVGNSKTLRLKTLVNQYKKDFRMASRDAAKYFKKGDFVNAFDAKVRSIIAYKAISQSYEAKLQIQKADQTEKMFLAHSKQGDYKRQFNPEVMLFGKAVVAYFNDQKKSVPFIQEQMIPEGSGLTSSDIMAVNSMLVDFHRVFGAQRGRGGFGQETINSRIVQGKVLTVLKKLARQAAKVEVAGQTQDFNETAEVISEEVDASGSSTINYEPEASPVKIATSYKISTQNMYVALDSLFKNTEEFVKSTLGKVVQATREGEAEASIETQNDVNRIQESFTAIAKTFKKDSALANIFAPILGRVPVLSSKVDETGRPIIFENSGIRFNNFPEYLMAELIMGSASGAEKLIRGNGDPSKVNYINGQIDISAWKKDRQALIDKGILKKEHFDALQDIWNLMKEKHAPLQQAVRDQDMYVIGKIEGWKVDTPFGTYDGAYIHIGSDQKLRDRASIENLHGDVDVPSVSPYETFEPFMNTGVTKSRNGQFYKLELTPNKLLVYVKGVNSIKHIRKPAKNLYRLLHHPDVESVLEEKRPGYLQHVFAPAYKRLLLQSRGTESKYDFINDTARYFRNSINIRLYLANLGTIFSQLAGTIPAIKLARVDNMAMSLASNTFKLATKQIPGRLDEIRAISPEMADRWNVGLKRHVQDLEELSTREDWIERLGRGFDNITYIPMSLSQMFTDVVIYDAALVKARKQGMSEAEANKFAVETVEKTQSSTAVSRLNNIQTSTAAVKFISGVAMNYQFGIYNYINTEAGRADTNMKKAGIYAGMFVLASFLPTLMINAFREDWDDEEELMEDKLGDLGMESIFGSMSTVAPMVASLPSGYYYSGTVEPIAGVGILRRDFQQGASAMRDMGRGIPMTPYEIKGMLRMLTILGGNKIPASALAKDVFIDEIYLELLNEESRDDRLKTRRRELRKFRREQRREARQKKRLLRERNR